MLVKNSENRHSTGVRKVDHIEWMNQERSRIWVGYATCSSQCGKVSQMLELGK
jgi:hypothetical protein